MHTRNAQAPSQIFESKQGDARRVQDHTLESFDGRGVRRLEKVGSRAKREREDFRAAKVFQKSLIASEKQVINPIEMLRRKKGLG